MLAQLADTFLKMNKSKELIGDPLAKAWTLDLPILAGYARQH